MRLIQFEDSTGQRRVGVVEGDSIQQVNGISSTRALALAAIANGRSLLQEVKAMGTALGPEGYTGLLESGRVLAPLDHEDPAHCLISGTGLTHLGSASTRDKMHQKNVDDQATLTDTARMFQWGIDGGRPAAGKVGAQPEWFYKGDGSIVRAGGQPLRMPDFALDGGEEPEIAGLYVIGDDGQPYRVGYAIGNEFSDHVTERQNYLYLAHSKLRVCSVGPALLVGELPPHIDGTSRVRDAAGNVRWEKAFVSGEENMSHTIANLEHHHFKYPLFKRPGDVHVHFFGTATLSFADGVSVAPGDTFEIEAPAFGPALRNRLDVFPTEFAKVSTL